MPQQRTREFLRLVDAAFPPAPQPAEESIAPHRCEECAELSRTFAPYSASDLPARVIEAHYGSLCLLSAEALAHYMPAYLRYAATHLSEGDCPSMVVEFLVYQLCPEPAPHDGYEQYLRRKLTGFSEQQGVLLEAFLDLVESEPDLPEFFGKWDWHRERFRELWRTRAEG